MKNKSIWQETAKNSSVDVLKKDVDTDILIIGCGISGMSIGLELLESKKNFIMVDMNEVGAGVTSKSTGKITYAQGAVYDKITTNYNSDVALKYYKAQKYAIDKVNKIIKKYNIDCDYEKVDSYVFATKAKDIGTIKKEEKFYKDNKIKVEVVDKLPNGYPIVYGLRLFNTGQFNPLKYVYSLKKIIKESTNKIYENTKVYYLEKLGDKYLVKTNRGVISAKKVVITTHYPFFIFPSMIPLKTHIERSYILSSKLATPKFSSITAIKPTISMRDYKEKTLLFSTNSHSSATHIDYKSSFEELQNKFKNSFKGEIDNIWSAHDVMTNDGIPYIGKIKNEEIFIATGYNKWGISNGILSGKIIGDYLNNKKYEYSDIFSLNRNFSLNRTITALSNNLKTGCVFVKTKLCPNPSFYKEAEVKTENGIRVGIYHGKDKDYKVKNTCPHMKCSLIFNEVEKVWECPCHGSSFDIEGNVLTGPSTYSIKL